MHGSDGQNRLKVNSFTEHLTTLDHIDTLLQRYQLSPMYVQN